MQIRDFFEKARLYIVKFIGKKESHDEIKKTISFITKFLSIFFIVGNYFSFLNVEDKHTWKGVTFFLLSAVYGLFCTWLLFETFWRK